MPKKFWISNFKINNFLPAGHNGVQAEIKSPKNLNPKPFFGIFPFFYSRNFKKNGLFGAVAVIKIRKLKITKKFKIEELFMTVLRLKNN